MKTKLAALTITAAILSSASAANAQEQNTCKTLAAADVCKAKVECSWVNSYTRKDGRSVRAFCRKKPVRQSSGTKLTPTPAGN